MRLRGGLASTQAGFVSGGFSAVAARESAGINGEQKVNVLVRHKLVPLPESNSPKLKLHSGSHVAVIGGGPAGSFFRYFLLDLAERVGVRGGII